MINYGNKGLVYAVVLDVLELEPKTLQSECVRFFLLEALRLNRAIPKSDLPEGEIGFGSIDEFVDAVVEDERELEIRKVGTCALPPFSDVKGWIDGVREEYEFKDDFSFPHNDEDYGTLKFGESEDELVRRFMRERGFEFYD